MAGDGQQWSAPVKTMAVKFQQWPTSQQGLEIVFKYVNNADHALGSTRLLSHVAFDFKMWGLLLVEQKSVILLNFTSDSLSIILYH